MAEWWLAARAGDPRVTGKGEMPPILGQHLGAGISWGPPAALRPSDGAASAEKSEGPWAPEPPAPGGSLSAAYEWLVIYSCVVQHRDRWAQAAAEHVECDGPRRKPRTANAPQKPEARTSTQRSSSTIPRQLPRQLEHLEATG